MNLVSATLQRIDVSSRKARIWYDRPNPVRKAAGWFIVVTLAGLAADIGAILISRFSEKKLLIQYNINSCDVILAYIMCLTSAVIIDKIYFRRQSSRTLTAILIIIFFLSLTAAAMSKCKILDSISTLNASYYLGAVSMTVCWVTKAHLYKKELNKRRR